MPSAPDRVRGIISRKIRENDRLEILLINGQV